MNNAAPRAPFENIAPEKWNDWRWQQSNRIRTLEELEGYIQLTEDEREACTRATPIFNMAITPYYLSLIDSQNPSQNALDPIRQQAIPRLDELQFRPLEFEDPLAEETNMPVAGLTHRYPDRVLLYTTHNCPVYCRHCFRKRKVGDSSSSQNRAALDKSLKYIEENSQIRDVVLSGGDALTFSDSRLEELLKKLQSIKHVEIIRVATRNPVTLPQRITPELCAMLSSYHPLYIMTHFNHPQECTEEAGLALRRLADHGCVVRNQTVLLKGINDKTEIISELNHWLLRQRTQPYYLLQCDAAQGISHFRTTIQTGLDIIAGLRGHTSGLAVPQYIVDLPGGGGKVGLVPESLVAKKGKVSTFRSYDGKLYDYEEG